VIVVLFVTASWLLLFLSLLVAVADVVATNGLFLLLLPVVAVVALSAMAGCCQWLIVAFK